MIARSRALTAVAVVAATALSAAVPAQSVSGTATAGKQRRHKIDMTWESTRSVRAGGVQFDYFKVTGTPWSTGRAATRTDVSQLRDDTRRPTFALLTPRVKVPDISQGEGRLGVEVNYLRTTTSFQTTAYRGEGVIRDSDRPSEYDGVITSLRGRMTCYFASGRCVGSLRLKGYIDY